LVGISADSRRIEQFEEAINNGEFLIMIDMETDQIEKIKTIIRKLHPEADFEGIEPHFFA
jgi:methyl coenzyme M reductase subunit D